METFNKMGDINFAIFDRCLAVCGKRYKIGLQLHVTMGR